MPDYDFSAMLHGRQPDYASLRMAGARACRVPLAGCQYVLRYACLGRRAAWVLQARFFLPAVLHPVPAQQFSASWAFSAS